MEKIDTIIFDLGGVIIKLNQPEAVRRFESLGLKNAAQMLATIELKQRGNEHGN